MVRGPLSVPFPTFRSGISHLVFYEGVEASSSISLRKRYTYNVSEQLFDYVAGSGGIGGATSFSSHLLESLGFVVNMEKSVLVPVRNCTSLGFK